MSTENEGQTDTQDLQLFLDELLESEREGLDDVSAYEAYVNSFEECAKKQKDELDVLSAVYGNDFTLLPSPEGGDTMIDIKIRNLFVENSHSFTFSVNIPATYPNVPPLFDIHELNGFKRHSIDLLWQSIIEIGEAKIGQPMLYDMISHCHEYIANLQTPKTAGPAGNGEGNKVFTAEQFKSNFRYSDLFSQIRQFENTHFKVLRVEDIRNVHRKAIFDEKFGKKEIKPIWVWHGTKMKNIPSIIANGLLPFGGVAVDYVNPWGNGIYVAKDPFISLVCSEKLSDQTASRLLLCALFPKATEQISEYSWGYVCRDGGMILPSYAVDVLDIKAYKARRNQARQVQAGMRKLMEMDFSDLQGEVARDLPFGYSERQCDEEHYEETREYTTEINVPTKEYERYVPEHKNEQFASKNKKAHKR